MDKVEIYTDGSCLKNPGQGGWAALIKYQGKEKVFTGGDKETTNNRMELMGPIVALEKINSLGKKLNVEIFSDSQYVIKGMSEWMSGWQRSGKINKPDFKNADLWKRLYSASLEQSIQWTWVRGHAGHPENERVDVLANTAARNFK